MYDLCNCWFWSHNPWNAKFKWLLWLSLSMNMVMARSQLSVFKRGKKGEDGKTKAQWWEREEEISPLEGVPDGQVFAIAVLLVVLDGHGLVPIIRFFIWNQLLFATFGFRINPRARGCPRWQSFGHFRSPCGSRWSRLVPNYPVFIWNQCLLTTFCSRIDPRARGCPRWPSFGHFRPSCGPSWSWMGLNYPYFIGNQLLFNTFWPTINLRPRGCPRWPSFGPFLASMRSMRVEVGLKLSIFHLWSIAYTHFWL